ncbi:MAG TPA: hypothetical protein VJ925_13850 [Longimicrobiales bacterium]|nr:hypothetical protein [Longimicrobiales bacterium]
MIARRAGTSRAFVTAAALIAVGVAACTAGRGSDRASVAGAECRTGVLEVSGADPFPELALVDSVGTRLEIAWDASELPALSGTTVELCVTGSPVEVREDIVRLDLVSVDGMHAVLGRVLARRVGATPESERLEVRIVRGSTGETLEVVATEEVADELAGRCAWIAGPIEGGRLTLTSYGLPPEGLCELAERTDTGG